MIRWSVGNGQLDEAVAWFGYSHIKNVDTVEDPPQVGWGTYISPRKGGPTPLTDAATARIRFFWVDGNPDGLPKHVSCCSDAAGSTPALSASALMKVYKPQVQDGGFQSHHQGITMDPETGGGEYGKIPWGHDDSVIYTNPKDWNGVSAKVDLNGSSNDRYFWAQLMIRGWMSQTKSGENEKPETLWSVQEPALDSFWPSAETQTDDPQIEARIKNVI
jgi:hypothetical protein